MNIQKIGFNPYSYPILQKQTSDYKQQQIQSDYNYNPIAYRDYNISFTGRTPEDFYNQDFNRDNMPSTMKDYLFFDYENRQHIPPEQMMREVFKYIEIADNFADVKSIYPNEELFQNLHENHKNSRKDVLSEIDAARGLSDAPLLKDGSDNFGMYLLRKIYLEGKTLKEISKDFLEKDINDEYKGIITEPVKYSTLDAYGISYPNLAFWKSFISTRDEYKKFFLTLPKNDVIPGVNVPTAKSHSTDAKSAVENPQKPKSHKRRFHIKSHQKKDIAKDIADKKVTDVESVKKIVRKRFGKDDPEASFIVRYMSPIMTVAAHRAHMSEELKAFAEYERNSGKAGDENTMLARFWKRNPKMLEVFSSAVTDTMDMFEDIYGEGGQIAINTNLEQITMQSEKRKIIDFVNPEFLDLLRYTQSIEPERTKRYELHDVLQKQWEEHFAERYGNMTSAPENDIQKPQTKEINEAEFEEKLNKEANKNGAKVYKLHRSDGQYGYITANLDQVLRDQVKSFAKYLPTKYADKYIKSTLEQDFSENFKLTLAVSSFNLRLPPEQQVDFDDERLQTREQHQEESYKLVKFHFDNSISERAARFAMIDTMLSNKDINLTDPETMKMPAYSIYEDMVAEDSSIDEFNSAMLANKKMIDRRYDSYSAPLTTSEVGKVMNVIFDCISNYNSQKTILDNKDVVEIISMMKEVMPIERNYETLNLFFSFLVKEYPFVKSLIFKGQNEDMKNAKFEVIMQLFNESLIAAIEHTPDMMTLFNSNVYDKHREYLSPETRKKFDLAVAQLSLNGRMAFFSDANDIMFKNSLLHFIPDWDKK